ncbi:hypothetical protein ACJX0J_029209, partial [Zea mays]
FHLQLPVSCSKEKDSDNDVAGKKETSEDKENTQTDVFMGQFLVNPDIDELMMTKINSVISFIRAWTNLWNIQKHIVVDEEKMEEVNYEIFSKGKIWCLLLITFAGDILR